MMKLIFSPLAAADIDQIYDYTETNWGWKQAEDYVFGMRDACEALSQGLKRGKTLENIAPGYEALPFQSHFIIYRYEAQSIVIIRILHRRMNLSAHL